VYPPAPMAQATDQLPVPLAEVRAIEREPEGGAALARRMAVSPAMQAAAVGATSFAAGTAAVFAVKHYRAMALARRRRRARRAGGEFVKILSSRSFLVDVSFVDRG